MVVICEAGKVRCERAKVFKWSIEAPAQKLVMVECVLRHALKKLDSAGMTRLRVVATPATDATTSLVYPSCK